MVVNRSKQTYIYHIQTLAVLTLFLPELYRHWLFLSFFCLNCWFFTGSSGTIYSTNSQKTLRAREGHDKNDVGWAMYLVGPGFGSVLQPGPEVGKRGAGTHRG